MKTVHLVGCVKRDIMRWIHRHAFGPIVDLSNWYCGTTHVDDHSKLTKYLEKNNIKDVYFRKWLTNDLTASLEVQKFFIKNGMKTKPVVKGDLREDIQFVFVIKTDNSEILDIVWKLLG